MQSKFIINITLLYITLHWINTGGNAFPDLKVDVCVENYPTQNDLYGLLHSLGKIINFSFAHCKQLSLDLFIGLFFVDVNLRFTNTDSMPSSYQIYLKNLLSTNHKSIACVRANPVPPSYQSYLNVVTLFKSARMWYTRQKSLKVKRQPKAAVPINTELEGYPDWETYLSIVLHWNVFSPSLNVSDICLMNLAKNKENPSAEQQQCRLPQDCYDLLINGSNYGATQTHRLLLLIGAHFGRGCTIFSDQEDKAMRDKFCEMIYVEAQYIADNGFHPVDLFLEQIALCSLDGHSEFISRQWMTSIQRFQTQHGCFKEQTIQPRLFIPASEHSKFPSSQKGNGVNNFLNGACSTHVTAVAAAAISASIRFILENDDELFVRCPT